MYQIASCQLHPYNGRSCIDDIDQHPHYRMAIGLLEAMDESRQNREYDEYTGYATPTN